MPLRIGETFAGYRILRLLGSGGMGEVYLVQHPRLPRKDALKVLADLVTDDPSVFLADFGIARPLDDTSGITTTNMTVGTVAYAAPEQLMGEPLDGRADQYALPATAYHLLTGLQLFPHSNPAVVIGRHLNSMPPALADTRPDLAVLDPVFAKALAKHPSDRFLGCAEFARTLAEQSQAKVRHHRSRPPKLRRGSGKPGRGNQVCCGPAADWHVWDTAIS